MKAGFEFHPRKVWEFVESRPFFNKDFYPQWNTAKEVFEKFVESDPKVLQKYADFQWSGSDKPHHHELEVMRKRENHSRLSANEQEEFPTYYDMKYANTSKIFEAEEVRGSTPDQVQKAEEMYEELIRRLETGEEVDEGLLGGLAGAGIGALVGPTLGKAMCKVLGVDPQGSLGRLLNSRLVTTALGYAIGKGK